MARIAFRQSTKSGKKASLDLATQDLASSEQDAACVPAHIQSVLELYSICLTRLLRLRAALMDGRSADAVLLRAQCRDILQALDDDLDRSVDLARNFHTLYQHCLRHLGQGEEDLLLEHVDAVEMVVRRLRHLYRHLVAEDSPT